MDPTKYPTKDQILSNLYIPSNLEILILIKWKSNNYDNKWKNITKEKKTKTLEKLIYDLCEGHMAENLEPDWNPKIQISENPWSYNLITQTINIDQNNPSIISALHELGHHFFGKSELLACQYSTGIFKTCFPKTYKNLVWKGHMLKSK